MAGKDTIEAGGIQAGDMRQSLALLRAETFGAAHGHHLSIRIHAIAPDPDLSQQFQKVSLPASQVQDILQTHKQRQVLSVHLLDRHRAAGVLSVKGEVIPSFLGSR